MRRLFLVVLIGILWILGLESLQAQNRIATESDVTKYGTYITPGDLLLDKPTNPVPFADGINQLRYTKVSASFPGLREGGTIWIDGDKIGPICEFRLLNGTETIPWHISSATIKPIPGTRVNGIYTKNSYGGFLYLLQGLKHLAMDGYSDWYHGVYDLQKGDFLKGRFGFGVTSTGFYDGFHGYSLSVLNGGTMDLKGLEGEHGFSVLRLQGGSYDWTVSIDIENCYIHDTGSEGFYIGATHGPPLAKIKINIKDCIFARTGSESIQLQHLFGNSHVRNITVYSADAGYLNQFQPGQDTGLQLNPDGGTTVIENIVVDSWGSHAINFFGSAFTITAAKTMVRNMALLNGRGEALYFHPSVKYGMNWTAENIYIHKPNGEYYINSKTARPNWMISSNNGTDSIRIWNIKFDGSVTLFQNTSKLIIGDLFKTTPAEIEYVNHGFYEPAHMIKFWFQKYAKYITGNDTTAVWYKKGEVIIDREVGKDPVFTKCIQDHRAIAVRPKDSPKFIVLKWDAEGVRSDRPNWNAAAIQRPYPPDDLRVKWNSFYGKNNIGFVEQAPTLDDLLSIIEQKDSTINILQTKLTGIFQDVDKYK